MLTNKEIIGEQVREYTGKIYNLGDAKEVASVLEAVWDANTICNQI